MTQNKLIEALEPFAKYADPSRRYPAFMSVTSGSSMGKRQLTMGDCYAAADALEALATAQAQEPVAGERDPADMEAVGNALMDAIEKDFASHSFMQGWHPADCPTEIVGDLLNALDEAAASPPAQAQEPVVRDIAGMKPCPLPWCRANTNPESGDNRLPYKAGRNRWHVACPYCATKGPTRKTKDGAIEAWNDRPITSPPAPSTPDAPREGTSLTKRVAKVVGEDGGCWSACSGCQESVDGYVSSRDYPYCPIFKCQPGSGCSECGGLGVVWMDGAFLASYGDALSEETTVATPDAREIVEAVILKGVGRINGDGWKDTTRKGEVVFVWNSEKPSPYKAGQFPRIGNGGWSASTDQYDFAPATAADIPEIIAALPLPTPSAPDAALRGARYLSDRFQWASPGDQQEDAWLLRFCDNDVGDCIWTGPDAEAEAWAAWNRHAPGYNCYLFRLAALSNSGQMEKGAQ